MNIEKIEINGHYVWVDKDAEIKEGDWVLSGNKTYQIKESAKDFLEHVKTISKKIIAASPELHLKGVPTYVEYLAEQEYPNANGSSKLLVSGFIQGYQTAEKGLPTWDDVRKAIDMAYSKGLARPNSGKLSDIPNLQEEIIEQLKQDKK